MTARPIQCFGRLIRQICLISLIGIITACMAVKVSAAPPPATSSAQVSTTIPTFFTPNDTTAPTAPLLLRPADGTYTSEKTLEFAWHQSTDIDSNKIIYTLYLNNVATYLGISNDGNAEGAGYTSRIEGGEVRLIPNPPLPDGTYDWYVTAEDLSGNKSYSASWHLTIDTVPPTILVTDIDTYHHLALDSTNPASVPPGTSFDVNGPKDVYFTVVTEPFATISLQYRTYLSYTSYQTYPFPTGSGGHVNSYAHFDPGTYEVLISAVDRAGQPAALPPLLLRVTAAAVTIGPIGPIGRIGPISFPAPLTSLPSTISYVATRVGMAGYVAISLAVLVLILLIFLWNRRDNLILVDEHGNPLAASVWHSRQYTSYMIYKSYKTYTGRLRVPHLGRYSTLTIRTSRITLVLSLCQNARVYTVIVPQ